MSTQKPAKLSLHQQTQYRIFVQGVLHENWQAYFSGFTITRHPHTRPIGLTVLTGKYIDHPKLLGTLNHLYTLGYPLLKVEWLEGDIIPNSYFRRR